MSDESLKFSILPATHPAEAYAADIARLKRTGPLGPSDDAWLMLAHALSRFTQLSAEELRRTAPQVADGVAVSAMASGLSALSTVMRAAAAIRTLENPFHRLPNGYDPVTELVVATQAVAEEQELAGAFGLAYATLHSLVQAFEDQMVTRMQGNVMAQLGRAARQLGATDVARESYELATVLGYECDALDVVARGLLGFGVLALTSGNYPSAREHFERALVNADLANDPELIRSAHHGLLNCGFASGDLDSAMVHGWNVLRLCIAPDSRAEALMNMAEICRLTGEHDAAMRTYAVAMEWTSHRHVRLHAMSGALQSAIAVNRRSEALRLLAELEELLPTIPDTFTRATVGIEIAGSLRLLGDDRAAAAYRSDALALATAHSYHELVHRAEQAESVPLIAETVPVEASKRDPRRKRPYRSEHFRMVLRSLNGLTAASLELSPTQCQGIVGAAAVCTSNHGMVGARLVVSVSALTRSESSGEVGSVAQAERPAARSTSAATVMRWRSVVMSMS